MERASAPTVLVCDDTPAKRYVITSWLRRAGYRVVEAKSAGEAIDVLGQEPVDLAVLDVHLPDRSGLELTSQIRAEKSLAATPVVHISAVAVETTDRVAGLDVGADAYLVDPIDPQEMLSTVRALLRTSGARRNAEKAVARSGRLHRATVRLNVAATPARLAAEVARAAAEVLDSVAVAMIVGDDGLGFCASASYGGAATTAAALPADRVAPMLESAVAEPTVRAHEDPWAGCFPVVGEPRWQLFPLREGALVGGFLAVPDGTTADDDQREKLLQRLVQAATVALGNQRALHHERRTALMLQRSLLPALLPDIAGLDLAARYRASERQAEVGGDFFDAFETDDGRCFVVIGDIQGHSLEAAVVMAELRYSLRAYAFDGYSPTEIVDRLDLLLGRRGDPELTATACIAVISADRSRMDVVNAGHLPPLVVRGGTGTYLDCEGPLLGLQVGAAEATCVSLHDGDRIVLMTDGVVERRDESLDSAMDRLATEVTASAGQPVETVADRVLERWGHGEDDVALLIVDVVAAP